MNRFLRICRSVHSWTGALLMPLILIIGATGFYLNHAQTVLGLLGDSTFSESGLKDMKPAQPVTEDSTRRLAETIWPDLPVLEIARGTYHGWPVLAAAKTGGLIMVSIKTGHYYAKTEFTRKTFAADGELLDTKYYWNAVFKSLH